MRVSGINAVKKLAQSCGVKSVLMIPKNKSLNRPTAECVFVKAKTYFYGYPKDYFNQCVMRVDLLESRGRGSGTRAIKQVVSESLKDEQTKGRVCLLASNINDAESHPFLFYYKLGFRSTEDYINELGKKGINLPAKADTYMYLPKENIKQCLGYVDKVELKYNSVK